MRFVHPNWRIIGQTKLNRADIGDFLYRMSEDLGLEFDSQDAQRWLDAHEDIDDLTLLTEAMGRLCYRSWAPGLNPNVTRIRTETAAYIHNLIDSGHGSVFEHASINFVFWNVSRVFTHELVRHRVGIAISQESMRYVRLDNIPVWLPNDAIFDDGETKEEFRHDVISMMTLMEQYQNKWANLLELDTVNSFEKKKLATSFLRRYFSPSGVATQIGWTCNIRELRWVLKQRTAPGAELEMQTVFGGVGSEMKERYPLLFEDVVTW